jgi:hypothetical protein
LEEERIAIADLADELQVRKQRIFKILKRLGITPTQRREPTRGNQMIATVTLGEAHAIRTEIEQGSSNGGPAEGRPGLQATDDAGYFYFIQLEPTLDKGRFKVGFTVDLDGRLQKHRCSAPFANYVKYWPCLRAWERTAMDCVTKGCEQLHTEVFRSTDINQSLALADSFFCLMPTVTLGDDDVPDQEPNLPQCSPDTPYS